MRFDKHKGQRLYNQFFGIYVPGMWWIPSIQNWVTDYLDIEDYNMASNFCRCNTVRAFRRHLRKHPCIKGRAVLRSRFVGYDVYA